MATPGVLTARPPPRAHAHEAKPGIHALHAGGALVYVPASLRPEQPAPLIVMLHGAGGDSMQAIRLLRHVADRDGILLLAPKSYASTWDGPARRTFGPDTRAIDDELREVFAQYAIEPAHIAVAGFSDGASYALSLGLSNGELFSEVLAFSPGYMAPEVMRGKPRIYIAHGTNDGVLNIDHCSRSLVPRLRDRGYTVEYREFDGAHAVPPEVASEAARWFLQPGGSA